MITYSTVFFYGSRLFLSRKLVYVIVIIVNTVAYSSDLQKQECKASITEIVSSALKINYIGWNGFPDAACKHHPLNPHQTIVAIAYHLEESESTLIVVALVDNYKNRVIASHRRYVVEDAGLRIDEGSLRIDTAPYLLANGVRAFGVDLQSGYIPHCGDGLPGAERTLYVHEGKILRPVFENLMMFYQVYVQGDRGRCSGPGESDTLIFNNYDFYIAISDSITNGYHDLLITATGSRSLETDSWEKEIKLKPFHFLCKYNGRQYPAADGILRDAFYKWIGF